MAIEPGREPRSVAVVLKVRDDHRGDSLELDDDELGWAGTRH
jgi:hypothetical protein